MSLEENISSKKEIETEYILSEDDKAKIDIKINEEIVEVEGENLSKNEFETEFPQSEVKEEQSATKDNLVVPEEAATSEEEFNQLEPVYPEDISEIKDIELIEDTLSEEMPPIEEYDLTYPTGM